MELIPIKVECYSGYKSDEYPKCFYHFNERFEVREILDRWYQGEQNPEFPVADYFKVTSTSGEEYLLKHELDQDEWYLCLGKDL